MFAIMIFFKKMLHTKIFLAPGTLYYSRCTIYGAKWYFLNILFRETNIYWIFEIWRPFLDVSTFKPGIFKKIMKSRRRKLYHQIAIFNVYTAFISAIS